VEGSDDLSKRYLRRARESAPDLEVPADQTIMSLWIGGIDASIDEQDVRDVFYSFGEIRGVRLLPDRSCGFVEFSTRQAAEEAAKRLFRALTIKGIKMDLDWAKPHSSAGQRSTAASGTPRTSSMSPAILIDSLCVFA
jgi:pre-mRNA-splicing factor RBM22/SLT11